MKCFYHPDVDAAATCSECGKGICSSCGQYVDGKMYCKDCAQPLRWQLERNAEDYERYLKRRKIGIIIELIITALFVLIGVVILSTGFTFWNFLGAWLITGIPGAIHLYFASRPKTYHEQVLHKLDKLYYNPGCLSSIVSCLICCCFGPVIAIIDLVELISSSKSSR